MKANVGMRGRVFRAVGAEGLGQLLNIAVRLLLVPLFLSAWGTQGYGEWLILTAAASWFSLADFGGQLYFINRMTESWAKRQMDEFQKIFMAGMFLFGVSSSVLMGGAGVVLTLSAIPSWLGIEDASHEVARWVLVIMSFRVLASLPLGLLLGVYRATGAQATSVMYGNLMLLIQLIASAAVLWYRGGMVLMACAEVIGLLLVSLLVVLDLRQRMPPEIKLFALHRPDMRIVQQAWVPSLHFLGIQLAMAVIIQGSVIVVAKTLGPFEVAVFSTLRTIANLVSRFLGMISHSAWPEFTRLESEGNQESLVRLFYSVLLTSTVTGLLYLAVLQHFGRELFALWLDNQMPYEQLAILLMGVYVIFSNFWTLGGNLLMATNRHYGYARVQLPVNLFALTASYMGGSWFGLDGMIAGLAAGQSIPMIIMTAWMLKQHGWQRVSHYLIGQPILIALIIPLYFNVWSAFLVTCLYALAGGYKIYKSEPTAR